MQRAEGKSASRQNPVDGLDSKRQDVAAMGRLTREALDALAQLIEDGIGGGRTHYMAHCAG
jgi:hypothetical protein